MNKLNLYLVKFTPVEPYFFGGEKNFKFLDEYRDPYFIRSGDYPSQTTIWGAIRYLTIDIKDRKSDSKYSKEEANEIAKRIGKESFNIDCSKELKQSFGDIVKISPIFLVKSDEYGEKKYVRVPMDYDFANDAESEKYKGFYEYEEKICTNVGNKKMPKEYNPKKGISKDWVCVKDNDKESSRIIKKSELIKSIEKVGIIKKTKGKEDDKAFFKREYKYLEKGFSFAVYLETEAEMQQKESVYLGQEKSTFIVEFKKISDCNSKEKISNLYCFEDDIEKSLKNMLFEDIAYAFGPIYISNQNDLKDLYSCCEFVCTEVQTYRVFNKDRSKKGKELFRIIAPGSVFKVIKEKEEEVKKLIKNLNCEQIGMNKIVFGTKKRNEENK